jgi:signal transduction histidine kinase
VLLAGRATESLSPGTVARSIHGQGSRTNIALYRIAQEALTNARRHARNVTRVRIEVAGDGERARLTVRDDGDPVPTNLTRYGFGLIGMRERVSLLGGTLLAGPGRDHGWLVEATLPTRAATTDPTRVSERWA